MYADVLYDEDSYSETDRSYLKKQSQWKGSEESSDEIKSLLTDTYGTTDRVRRRHIGDGIQI